MPSVRRQSPRLLVALALALLVVVLSASSASAHAVVTSSIPADGEHLAKAPTEVTIQFSEAVSTDLGGLKVLDANGNRVDNGDSSQPTPASLHATLHDGLSDGTYVGNYKVISADGHAISGAIVFTVGNASAVDVSKLTEKNDPTFEIVSKIGQFLTYVGALLAAGLAFFLAFLYQPGPERPRLEKMTRRATVLAAVGIVVTIVAQAALATSQGVGAAFNTTTLGPVLRQGLGWSAAVLFLGLALCHLSVDIQKKAVGQGLAFYGGITVTTSFVLWGHATESSMAWLAIPADVLHVSVAAVWFGGLVGLGIVLHSRRKLFGTTATDPSGEALTDEQREDSLKSTVEVVHRFSTTAAASVVLLVIAGVALGYAELGTFGALTSTSYGLTLLVKVAAVAIILFLAAYNRFFLLPWLFEADGTGGAGGAAADVAPSPDDDAVDAVDATDGVKTADSPVPEVDHIEAGWRTLVRTVRFEALGIVAVLAITAVLVNTTPGITTVANGEAFDQTQPFRDGTVQLVITPNRAGSNSFHLDFGKDGKPADLAQKVTLEFRLPSKDLGPITREMVKAGEGHFLLENINDLSIPGDWQVRLIVRVSDFDQQNVDFQDTVT